MQGSFGQRGNVGLFQTSVAETSFEQSGFLPDLPSSLNYCNRRTSVFLPALLSCFASPILLLKVPCSRTLQQRGLKKYGCIAWSEQPVLLQHPRADDFSSWQKFKIQ